MDTDRRPRVVVLGAGIGGLCAAAALRHQVGEPIVIIERDRLPLTPSPRRGVPQSNQLHNLLGAAQDNLERLIPGFLAALDEAGGVRARVSADTHVFELGQRMPERDLGMHIVCAPRPVIEHVARQLVCADERIQVRGATAATGLVIDGGTVRGVRVRSDTDSAERTLPADLVVDATGAGSAGREWLAATGSAVEEEIARVAQWYATARYRCHAPLEPWPRFWLLFPTPPKMRGGLASPIDRLTLSVSLNGGPDDSPPRTSQDFQRYSQTLEDPAIAELLAVSTPMSSPTVFRRSFAIRRHFDRPRSPVIGYLPIGDAFATLNPLFGQGVSVAATQAVALRVAAATTSSRAELTSRYLDDAAAAIAAAWELGSLVAGGKGWRQVFRDRESALRFGRLLCGDPELHRAYVAMWHLLEPITAVDTPEVRARLGVGETVP